MLRFELIKIGVSLLLFSLTFSIQADSLTGLTGLNSLRISSENYDSENCGASTQKLKDEMRYWLGKILKLFQTMLSQRVTHISSPLCVLPASTLLLWKHNVLNQMSGEIGDRSEREKTTLLGVFSIYSNGESFFSHENQMLGYKEEIVQDFNKRFIVEWRNANQ